MLTLYFLLQYMNKSILKTKLSTIVGVWVKKTTTMINKCRKNQPAFSGHSENELRGHD